MDSKVYDTLPQEAVRIRKAVFIEEQGFQNEFDYLDDRAKHLVVFEQGVPMATCRFFQAEEPGNFIVGRIAVAKQYRGRNIGSHILHMAEVQIQKLGGTSVCLHAQMQAEPFYKKNGYCKYGEADLEENCPHIWMRKEIG